MPKKTNEEVGRTNILVRKEIAEKFFKKLGIDPIKHNRMDAKEAIFSLYNLGKPDLSVVPRKTLEEQNPDNAYEIPLTKYEHDQFMRLFNFGPEDTFSEISHRVEEDVLHKRIGCIDRMTKSMNERIIFLNIGWMKKYQGIHADKITGGGSFVKDKGYGHEIFNFLPLGGHMYGYVQPKGSINIERLGADSHNDSIGNVLSVWVSASPSGGVYIVGWYANSTVYRHWQSAPKGSNRKHKKEEFGYFVKAKAEDCVLLPIDKRILKIPRGKGGMGQANVWYADKSDNSGFIKIVLNFIEEGKVPKIAHKQKNGRNFQPDPFKRQKIEKEAIKIVTAHYAKLGYEVTSFEKDNVGWDLEASLNINKLRLEVKGLSQDNISIDVTPNEYDNMKRYKDTYRVCVVTNTLEKKPSLSIFSYSPENKSWENENGQQLDIVEVVSARMSAK